MWARAQFDIRDADLRFGLRRCLSAGPREGLERDLETLWSPRGDAIVAYSVRSAFDLVLQALAFPPGSEVLLSALNIKGMVKVAKRLGLVPVPIDLDIATGRPLPESMERAISPRTRAALIAPLYGARFDPAPLIAIARRHGLRYLEDCAQAFNGTGWTGTEAADVSMFSFGPLKFATALGGSMVRVRDPGLLARMRAIQDGWPVQPTKEYFGRLLRFRGLRLLTARPVLGTIERFYRMRGLDYEDAVTDKVRGVAKLGSAKRIRKRCSAALLEVMRRRIAAFRPEALEGRRQRARRLLDLLGGAVVTPGTANADHNFWAFPVLVEDPGAAMWDLRRAGFDAATLRRSEAVAPPEDRPELTAVAARDALARLVVVPCYDPMPDAALVREAEVIRAAAANARRAETAVAV